MLKIGPDLLMVAYDYIFDQRTGKAYEINRQGKVRIRGEFAALSPDRQTVVFTTSHLLYQYHYLSHEVYIEPIDEQQKAKIIGNKGSVLNFV